jgi:alpha-beta hydrolase superfamily lysophospholipase
MPRDTPGQSVPAVMTRATTRPEDLRMNVEDLTIDVDGIVGSDEHLFTAATVYVPETVHREPVVVFAFPGGSYNRRYFDLRLAGYEGYSQAEHLTAAGFVFVACDHLGVGDSAMPQDPFALGYEDLAAANAGTVAGVLERLRGGLTPTIGPLQPGSVIGLGQSVGGCLLTVQQGLHATFDAVGMLGWTNIHIQFPDPSGERVTLEGVPRGMDARALETAVRERPMSVSAELRRYVYHYDDEPQEIVDADMGAELGGPPAPWRSASPPACAASMVLPGTTAEEAARIEQPVLVVAGERDVIADPLAEAKAYERSSDVTVAQFARMGHMHNFASTRKRLWDRLASWINMVDQEYSRRRPSTA